ncbi:hypothetical protein FJV41_22455 [Myxococcus llanfairpwllgwyngyllgogerychwyrndrobwllllantysiliogogogochensis]|uniref:HK97 gp10 family phage protein n=1 Tax=Myxococcus llanfairpwllgwyngyllgogerychwyrndrobwllllantysiliogogogochensis TaxID=2590453 RepID=A0A540WXK0_9BACT|nr:hypothetical protein [Myxococcus llanfairpwllgwyngyllgogerychwyrndrobwllllantysiliogogogochensis]TQF13735.1 hypothetical protein FJV41_22455 [Myxococcus llanfairpwllgwyngyllgogerychwyrndrobwllllantysiliogogogochensis]
MPLKVALDFRLLDKLRKVEGPVLDDLAPLAREHASTVLQASRTLVPVGKRDTDGKPPLSTTGFVDGPAVNGEKSSVSATAGYEHEAAGAIHEGFHWGTQRFAEPVHFLRKPARKGRAKFRKAVATQILATLSRLFPSR